MSAGTTVGDGDVATILAVTSDNAADTATVQVGRGLSNGIASDAEVATFIVTVLSAPTGAADTCIVQAQGIAQQGAQSAAP